MNYIKLAFALLLGWSTATMAAPQGFALHDAAQPIANVRFVTEDGTKLDMESFQGKVLLLNIWATWCVPCREEMPELSELNTEYQDKNVIVIGIALDEIALIKEFNAENKMSYPLLAAEDTGGNLAANLGNNKSALPYTVIIKPDGTVANTYFGRISKPLLEEALLKLIP